MTVGTLFPLAIDARNGARNNLLIFNEVSSIQTQILGAITAGQFHVIISNTRMTSQPTGVDYYNVWQNLNTSNLDVAVLTDQMSQVMYFFTSLGYSVIQLESQIDPTLFVWQIQW